MPKSFQKEKPPARVNLFLEVETGGAKEKVELPFRMLMVGDYTAREEETPVEDREIINVNKNNFDSVMESMDLELEYTVPNRLKGGDEAMEVNLEFENMDSFHPEKVAEQVPAMHRMLAMRNLLQDLRNRVVSMSQFRKQLEKIVQDREALGKLADELDKFIAREASDGGAETEE
jgi:type VI secretion system protein ImpB